MTHSWKTSERSMQKVVLPSAGYVRKKLLRCFLCTTAFLHLKYCWLGWGAYMQEGLWWRQSQAIWTPWPMASPFLFCQEPVWISLDMHWAILTLQFPGILWCSSHPQKILLVWTHLAKMIRFCFQYSPISIVIIISTQDMLRKELPKMKRKVEASKDEPDAKKIKVDPAEEKQKEEMKKQNKRFVWFLWDFGKVFLCHLRMFYYRDLMKKHMKKKELEALLEHNKQEIPVGEVEKLPKPYRGKTARNLAIQIHF